MVWNKGGLRSSIWVSRGKRDHVGGYSSGSWVHKLVVGLDQDCTQVGLLMIPKPTGPTRMEEGISPSMGDPRLLNQESHTLVMSKAPHEASDAQDIIGTDVFLTEKSPAPPEKAGTT